MLRSWARPLLVCVGATVAIGIVWGLKTQGMLGATSAAPAKGAETQVGVSQAKSTESGAATSTGQAGAVAPAPATPARAAARYVCDMHCEPGKVYNRPGFCPVCRMNLSEWERVGYSIAIESSSPGASGEPASVVLRTLDPSGLDTSDAVIERLTAVAGDLSKVEALRPSIKKDVPYRTQAIFPGEVRTPTVIFAELVDKSGKTIGAPAANFVPKGASPAPVTLPEDYDIVQHDGDYEVRIRCNGRKFFSGEVSHIRLGVTVANEPVVDLEPISPGAPDLGELLVVRAEPPLFGRLKPIVLTDAPGTARCPVSPEVLESAKSIAGLNGSPKDLSFVTQFPYPGKYRVLATLQHKGKPIRAAFTIDALPPNAEPTQSAPTHEHAPSGG